MRIYFILSIRICCCYFLTKCIERFHIKHNVIGIICTWGPQSSTPLHVLDAGVFSCIHTWMEHSCVYKHWTTKTQCAAYVFVLSCVFSIEWKLFFYFKQTIQMYVNLRTRGRAVQSVCKHTRVYQIRTNISIWKWLIRAKSMRSQCVVLMKYEVCVHL